MRWLVLLGVVTACKRDPAQPPVPTGGSSTIAPPIRVEADPAIGPIGDPIAYCSNTTKDVPVNHAPECSLGAERAIAIGPWVAAGWLRLSRDTIAGEIVIRPAVETAAGWWLIGAREDCGQLSEHGPCRVSIIDTRVGNDELDLTYRIARGSGDAGSGANDRVLHCTSGDTISCEYAR
jgi:hypothetical protein